MKPAKQICIVSVTVHYLILLEILVPLLVGFLQQDYELQYLFVRKNSNLICLVE